MDRHFIHFETPELATIVTDTAPPAGPEEVLIKVDHAGINRADLLQRLGLYPAAGGRVPHTRTGSGRPGSRGWRALHSTETGR